MTIDEAIEKHRKIVETQKMLYDVCVLKESNKHFLRAAEEHEQLAEWLEELKELRKIKEDYSKGMQASYATFMYNKALEDFVKFANTMPTVETEDGEIRPMWLEEMEEQLKK